LPPAATAAIELVFRHFSPADITADAAAIIFEITPDFRDIIAISAFATLQPLFRRVFISL
jgi:hypothetical protein